MTDNEIKILCEKIESLHAKILNSKFAETVTESEMLSLILAVQELNRQRADIERLKDVKKHIHNLILIDCDYSTAEAYNRAFQKALEQLYDNANIKSEAIKEFAERLKESEGKITTMFLCRENITTYVPLENIDNIVKEMVGE